MTSEDLRSALEEVGMAQTEFAKSAHYSARMIRNYVAGRYEIPETVAERARSLVAAHRRRTARAA